MPKPESPPPLTGRCLCGGVSYRISGPRRDVILCHCENCRRTHGHVAAYIALAKSSLELIRQETLQWYHDRSPDTYRGFCNRCGASLLWDARAGRDRISVAAGSLDDSADIETIGHIYLAEAGGYYSVDDGLPRFEQGSGGALEADDSG